MSDIYDVAVIGGGAAGLCASVVLKMRDPLLSVVLIERLSRVGKKLITTGNGRCNITNMNILPECYHSENVEFPLYALQTYDRVFVEHFFAELGIVFTFDADGKAYPYSLQASSVVDALRFSAENLGVKFRTDTKVIGLDKKRIFNISTDKGNFEARTVLVAAGLYSGGEKLGCDGSMLKILNYPTVKTTPAIVQIKTKNDIAKQLKGIKVNAQATLKCEGKDIRSEYGEVLFCDYGLSGPPILQISREAERLKGSKQVVLDIMPDYDFNKVFELLRYRASVLYMRDLDEFFTGMLNKRVGQTVIKLAGKQLSDKVSSLKTSDLKKMVSVIKGFTFEVTGTTGFLNSQVTAGGLDTDSFDPQTMMSKRDSGLFAAGEILDVDGDCGGFNLQWAWSSAMCAADGIALYLGGAI